LDDDDVPLVNDLPLANEISEKPLSEVVELVSDTLPLMLTVCDAQLAGTEPPTHVPVAAQLPPVVVVL
jgi:hypothetical protein